MKETYSYEVTGFTKRIWKLLGIRRIDYDSISCNWGYFSPKFGLSLQYGLEYDECRPYISWAFIWGVFHITLPFTKPKDMDVEERENHSRGFYIFDNTLVFTWKSWSKHIDLPFVSYVFETHEVWSKDGWVKPDDYLPEPRDNRVVEVYPYKYVLRSGEVQEVTATVCREYRQWHRKWLPFVKLRKECIDIHFSQEVGERSGSWKGGCIGCSWPILKGESMQDCLKRMEETREFT